MAAGNAARFGENKLAAMVNGKPLIEHALEAIPRESFSRVLVVTQHKNVEAAAKNFGFETLRNEHPERGQSETIRFGTAALSDCDALCFMVADQPMLKRKTVAQELEFFRAHSKTSSDWDTTACGATPASSLPASFLSFYRLRAMSAAARSSRGI